MSNLQSPVALIKDPIHGYVRVTEVEKSVIDTLAVQRLRRLKQLAGTEFVYPGANHSRFEHALGTMHLTGYLFDELLSSGAPLDDFDRTKIRLAGLLHDLGHGPFSHLFEVIFETQNRTHEDLTIWLIKETDIADVLRDVGIDPTEQSQLSVGKWSGEKPWLSEFIRSTVDCDKQDFLLRDSFHTGAGYGTTLDIERLNNQIRLIDDHLAVDIRSLAMIETFLIARVQCFRSIYFHKTARGAQKLLARALRLAHEEEEIFNFKTPEDYLSWDDFTTWTYLVKNEKTKPYMDALRKRQLLNCVYDDQFISASRFQTRLLSSERAREMICSEIAQKSGIDDDEVYIDVPTIPTIPSIGALHIKLFKESRGKIKTFDLTTRSKVLDVIRGILTHVRIYISPEHSEEIARKVEAAAEDVFQEPAYAERMST